MNNRQLQLPLEVVVKDNIVIVRSGYFEDVNNDNNLIVLSETISYTYNAIKEALSYKNQLYNNKL